MTNTSSVAVSGRPGDAEVAEEDIQELVRNFAGAQQELDAILRLLEGQRCPVSRLSWDDCHGCRREDPRHGRRGLATMMRDVVEGPYRKLLDMFRLYVRPPRAER